MVVYPVSSSPLSIRKLAGFHFADDDGSGINETLDRNRIGGRGRVEAIEGPITIAGLDARNIIDILNSEPDTCERFGIRPGVV